MNQNGPAQALQQPVVAPTQIPETAAPERQDWAPVFGRYEPDPPPPPEPEPEVTTVNHSYLLKGLFAGDANSWAIVEDGGGEEYLLRVGDELPGGAIVSSITSEGVHLDSPEGPELIAFDE